MFSPFIVRHVAILALACGNFALAVWMASWSGRNFSSASLARGVVQRALAVSYAGAALLVVLMAVILFVDIELTDKAKQCWRVNRRWAEVRAGMTKAEIVRLLGKPAEIVFVDQYLYAIHPLTYSHAGIGFKNPNPSADPAIELDDSARVEDKNPDDASARWIPGDFDFYFRDQYYSVLDGLAALCLLVLAIVSLIPRNLQAGWGLLALYFPALAVIFGVTYESVQRGGWRFDLFFLLPVYTAVAVSWAVRMITLWRR
jgi:hypothetical protein